MKHLSEYWVVYVLAYLCFAGIYFGIYKPTPAPRNFQDLVKDLVKAGCLKK